MRKIAKNIEKIANYSYKNLELLLVFFAALWLRLVNLGYSDYQGDEIKAFLIPQKGQSVIDFLLTQRKGPIQFIVTYLLQFITPNYANRFLVRLPFAVAGSLAVLFFFKLVFMHTGNKKVALFSSLFMATNGFLVGLSRIAQYQSFVIFFMILALYFFSLSVEKDSWKKTGIYLGFISWALSILSHYDGVFIGPFVAYLLYVWAKKYNLLSAKKLIKEIFLPIMVFVLPILLFYVPFALKISDSTFDYWKNRVSSSNKKISSSTYLFTVYQPIYVIHFYYLFGFLALIPVLNKIFFCVKAKKLDASLFELALIVWFTISWVFLEVIVDIPGTHIYTYLIPAFIFLGFGIDYAGKLMAKLFGRIIFANFLFCLGCAVFFLFIFLQSHQIFVDHQKEYPWENEKFLIWTFHEPSAVFHLSMFGFPYYRNWDEIGNIVMNSKNNGYYSTNERESISRYHIGLTKDSNQSGHYIYIRNPQSFTKKITNPKVSYWMSKYPPIVTFFKSGEPVTEIYFMPQGNLEEIQALGY